MSEKKMMVRMREEGRERNERRGGEKNLGGEMKGTSPCVSGRLAWALNVFAEKIYE